MACINTDGSITDTARALLRLVSTVPLSAEEISSRTGQPLFRIRSNLRELTDAGLIGEKNGAYATTVPGKLKLIDTLRSTDKKMGRTPDFSRSP